MCHNVIIERGQVTVRFSGGTTRDFPLEVNSLWYHLCSSCAQFKRDEAVHLVVCHNVNTEHGLAAAWFSGFNTLSRPGVVK